MPAPTIICLDWDIKPHYEGYSVRGKRIREIEKRLSDLEKKKGVLQNELSKLQSAALKEEIALKILKSK